MKGLHKKKQLRKTGSPLYAIFVDGKLFLCMKIFQDLVFIPEGNSPDMNISKAVLGFENGYGVSVLQGSGALSTPEKPYELAVIKYDENGGYKLIYPTLFNSDVIPFLTSEDVTSYMKIIQSLPELF